MSALLPFLKRANTLGEVRQAREPGVLLLELLQRARRRPPHRLPAADRFAGRDAGLRTNDCAVFNFAVVRDSHLTTYNHARADRARTELSPIRTLWAI